MKRCIAPLILFVFMAGCASMITTVKPKDPADTLKGYVYGQFYQENKVQTRINLIVRNLDTNKTDSINLDMKGLFGGPEKFGVSSIVPGRYRIEKVDISFNEIRNKVQYSFSDRKDFSHPVYSKPFEVKAGEKVYLGDFVAESDTAGTSLKWSMKVGSSFADTTKTINETYKNLTAFPSREAFSAK